jgi:hypothetical protein
MATPGFVFDERLLQHETDHAPSLWPPNDIIALEQHSESPVHLCHTVNAGNSHNICHQGGKRCNLE